MSEAYGDRIEIHLSLPQPSVVAGGASIRKKEAIINVIRVPGLRKGKRITIEGHPTLTGEYLVNGLAPLRYPQYETYKVGTIR